MVVGDAQVVWAVAADPIDPAASKRRNVRRGNIPEPDSEFRRQTNAAIDRPVRLHLVAAIIGVTQGPIPGRRTHAGIARAKRAATPRVGGFRPRRGDENRRKKKALADETVTGNVHDRWDD